MIRTIVVLQVSKRLFAVELKDLSAKPQQGEFLVFRGNRLQVVDVTESLGERALNGSKRSGNTKLLEILDVLMPDKTTALGLFASLMYVGSKDGKATRSRGLITAGSGLVGEFDNVVFVRLRPDKPAVSESTLVQLAFRTEQMMPVSSQASTAVEPIRVMEESAGDGASPAKAS